MPTNEGVSVVPEMSTDSRVRVFRRTLTSIEDFAGMEVDAYVVITRNYAVVCDTLLCPEDAAVMMQEVAQDIVGRQLLVVNSHADWDHAWGNAHFTGQYAAPILAHNHGLARMRAKETRLTLADYQSHYPVFRNVQLTPATLTFSQELTIHGGDLSIKLLPAPGHHRDHIAAWLPEVRLLLAFDAVEKPLPCIENAEAVPSMFDTLERFLALQPDRVLCSHGKTTSPALVRENLAYLHEIEQGCRKFLRKLHPTLEELAQAADLIAYPLDSVIKNASEPVDSTFYSSAHNANVRYMFEWLMM